MRFEARDFSSPNCRQDFQLTMPYTTQCARQIFRAIPKYHPFRSDILDACDGFENLSLDVINDAMGGAPALVAGPDSANPRFPQTLANLLKWRERSAMGRIYYEALGLVAGLRGAPCCFIRAKGDKYHVSGKWAGANIRENFVMHEFTGHKYVDHDAVLARFDLPGRGLVFVEHRVTFIKSLVEYFINDVYGG